MKAILKGRWFFVGAWLALTIVLMLVAPNLAELVREKGQITVPDDYSSSYAAKLLEEKSGAKGKGNATALVFHQDGGMSDDEIAEVKSAVHILQQSKDVLGISAINTHFEQPDLTSQMVSEDKSTIVVLLTLQLGERTAVEVQEALYNALDSIDVDHYYTGSWMITEDVLLSSELGLKKTESITIVFILFILFLVFRSFAAPFVPLLTVGISYLISQSIVAYLSYYWDFPLSTFTQIFMVAILFGIGTDYCILLISRFKEELSKHGDKQEAILKTYRTAGKTVFISGIAVLVGFCSIGFSTFILYRSAVAVAVGIAVMLIALYTVVPFFMYTLGSKLFWPVKGKLEHGHNKLWDKVGAFSLSKPLYAVIILAVIIVPLLLSKQNLTSFNSLDEIGEKYNSVKAFNLLSDAFGPGEALPTTVVIKSDQPFDTSEGMAFIEQTSRALLQMDGVALVRSATRPLGQELDEFLVADQVQILDDGLSQGQAGLDEISSGLAEASQALTNNAPRLQEAVDGANQLVAGSKQLQTGVSALSDGLTELATGMKQGTSSALQLSKGMNELEKNAQQLADASEQLVTGYNELHTSMTKLAGGYEQIALQQQSLSTGLAAVEQRMIGLQQQYPELASDPTYVQLQASIKQLSAGSVELASALQTLNESLQLVTTSMEQANQSLQQASAGQAAFSTGIVQVADGIAALADGLEQLYAGQQKGISALPQLSEGISGLTEGQEQLQAGFESIQSQLSELTDGLVKSVDGLDQVSDGIGSANLYLQGLVKSPDKQLTGWYIPKDVITSEDFAPILAQYMSEDRRIISIDVIMDQNPYSLTAMGVIDQLKAEVNKQLTSTNFEGSQVEIGGITSMNNDLNHLSSEDYSRTVVLMLVGIFIILLILFRSVVIPIYLVVSLLITYSTSLAMTEIIFVRIVGLSGVSWSVPFFGFVILLALGVDYSIFLMDRFKENRELTPAAGIHEAMKSMGSVIMSAALILGGTFAAMLPSGVMSLLQIATLVLCGLFLYALVMLPLFIPVVVKLFGKYNWWPLMSRK